MASRIQGVEESLGLQLLERTTRSIKATPAGEFLYRESGRVLGDVEQTVRRLREDFSEAPKQIRIGVSRTLSLAHLPGFLHANVRRQPHITCRVSSLRSSEVLTAVESSEIDIGVLTMPARLPREFTVSHRFKDAFILIAPTDRAAEFRALKRSRNARLDWLRAQSWLLIEEHTTTGGRLRAWMKRQGLRWEPIMQLDSFDLIINLVALGLGVSFVPIRALALYGRKRTIVRLPLEERFVREIVCVTRRRRDMPEHIQQFVDNVLF